MTKERFKAIMDQVVNEIPMTLGEGLRSNAWPRRWKELRKYVEADINLNATTWIMKCGLCGRTLTEGECLNCKVWGE
jgi:hypothetical protein